MDPEGFRYGSSNEEGSDADEISALTEPTFTGTYSIINDNKLPAEQAEPEKYSGCSDPGNKAYSGCNELGNEADVEAYSGCSSDTSNGSDDDDDDDGFTEDDNQEDSTKELSPNQATGLNNGPIMNELAADLCGQNDPARMGLTQEEHQWAVAVKAAIEKIPDLDNLTDFMYAQIAIVSKGNVDDAVVRAFRLQEHKKDNLILDTLDDALRHLPKDGFLSIDFNLQSGGYIVAFDIGNYSNGAIWSNPDETCYYNRRAFYATHMTLCDLEALRVGGTILCECEGYQLVKGKTLSLTAFQSIWKSVHAYPRKIKQVKFFNAPPLFKMMVSMAKAVLPTEVTSKFQLNAKCPLGRLDRLYCMPTPEIARARLKERIKGLLVKRYANEANFSLDGHAPFLEVA
ncbi:expressed unknown protein [Seminavis robusta]|uniref:CRAL-TRIO domain-containing protein n=1 Tax=Seminavis robusta TaxID=568900 RepID=A0A9N8HNP8_9STRA|nr:expressed unknown protein [Seminavis robusta]|eukprot:Sro1103_g241671.1  (400) ;mRNA; r:9929-11128